MSVIAWFLLFLCSDTIVYVIIIVCAIKIRAKLAKQMKMVEMNTKMIELNAQITRTLLIQVQKSNNLKFL